jgi:hypothetical protein
MASSILIPLKTVFDDKGLKDAQRQFGQLGSSLKSTLGAIGIGIGIGVISNALRDSAKAAVEDGKSQALLAQQLRNTVGATKEQTAAVEASISKMQLMSSVADDQIRPAFASLVRATGDVEKATTLTNLALDVAAGTGKDLGAVSLALGKAVNGSTTSLQKLVPSIKGAKDPMRELAAEFNGAAEAAANADPFQRLSVIFGEIQEQIGVALLPALQEMATYLASPAGQAEIAGLVTVFKDLAGAVGGVIRYLKDNYKWILEIAKTALVLWGVAKIFGAIQIAVKAATVMMGIFNGTLLLNPIYLAIAGVAALGTAIKTLYDIASTVPTQRETAGVPAAVAKAATEAGVKAYKAAMKNSSDIQGAIEAKRKATADVVNAYRSQQAEIARLTGAANAFNAAKLVTTDPFADLLTPKTSGGVKTTATKVSATFFDSLLEENRKQMARIRLSKVGISGSLQDAIIGSGDTWFATATKIINSSEPALAALRKQWSLTGTAISEAAEAAAKVTAENMAKLERAVADAEAVIADIDAALNPVAKSVIEIYNDAKSAYESLKTSSDAFAKSIPDVVAGIKNMTDLAEPIGQFESQVVASFNNVESSLKNALDTKLITDKAYADLSSWAKREMSLMQDIAKQRDALANRISLAESVYNDAKNSIMAYGNINSALKSTSQTITETQTKIVDGISLTLTKSVEQISSVSLVDQYKSILAKTKEFAANLNTLRKMGLNKDLFKQIVDAGVDAGGATATALIAGGQQSVTELNGVFTELQAVGDQVGESTAVVMYNNGVDVMGGFINGMKAQADALAATAKTLADSFATEFAKTLKAALKEAIDEANKALVKALGDLIAARDKAAADLAAAKTALTAPVVAAPVGNFDDTVLVRNGSTVLGGSTGGGAIVGGSTFYVNVTSNDPNAVVDALRVYQKRNGLAVFA